MYITGNTWQAFKMLDYAFRFCKEKSDVKDLYLYKKQEKEKIIESYGSLTAKELREGIEDIRSRDKKERKERMDALKKENLTSPMFYILFGAASYLVASKIVEYKNETLKSKAKIEKRNRIIDSVIMFILMFEENSIFSISGKALSLRLCNENLRSDILRSNRPKRDLNVELNELQTKFFCIRSGACEILLDDNSEIDQIGVNRLVEKGERVSRNKINNLKIEYINAHINKYEKARESKLEMDDFSFTFYNENPIYTEESKIKIETYQKEVCEDSLEYFRIIELQKFT